MIYFKLFIGDYQRDTAALTLAEHGAYMMMLQHYYATKKPLPDGRGLYRLLRAETKQDREAVDLVVSRFWVSTESGLINGRADIEMEKAEKKAETNRENGRLGGRPKETQKKPRNNPPGYFSDTETEANEKLCHSHSHIPTSLRSVGRARATRLPPNWEPSDADWGNACIALHTTGAQLELEKFRDYWAAKAGSGGSKLDWDATWRNWIRKAEEYAKSSRAGEKLSVVERVRRDCAEWARNRAGSDGILVENGEPVRPQVDQPIRLVAGRIMGDSFDDVGF